MARENIIVTFKQFFNKKSTKGKSITGGQVCIKRKLHF